MTRTWVNIKGYPLIARGGIWRGSAEWGPVYSGVMTNTNDAINLLHDRMPVFLFENEWDKWMLELLVYITVASALPYTLSLTRLCNVHPT